ncbi:MAG: hypothetical protein QM757_33655 [Paludibaculum sp.]
MMFSRHLHMELEAQAVFRLEGLRAAARRIGQMGGARGDLVGFSVPMEDRELGRHVLK